MTTRRDETEYYGNPFRTLLEARWAVFFNTLDDQWHYEPDGWRIGNPEHYRPQLWIQRFDGSIYLEVQPEWDRDNRQPMLHTDPEVTEHHVYLAAGELPDEGQLRHAGWWDPAGRGVLQLTAGYDWAALYPPDSDDVLAALEAAHADVRAANSATPPGRRTGARRQGGAGTTTAVSLRECPGPWVMTGTRETVAPVGTGLARTVS